MLLQDNPWSLQNVTADHWGLPEVTLTSDVDLDPSPTGGEVPLAVSLHAM